MKLNPHSRVCCSNTDTRSWASRFPGKWRELFNAVGFLVPRLAGCILTVFGLLFAAAEVAGQVHQPVVFPDAGSLMEADYGSWDVPLRFSSRAGLLEEIKSGSSYGIKNPEAAFIDWGEPDGFLPGSMAGNPDGGTRSVMPGDEGSREEGAADFSQPEEPADSNPVEYIPEEGDQEDAGEENSEGSALEEAQEILQSLDPANPDTGVSREEVREIVEEIREELRPDDGNLRDLDPDLVDQARELQELLEQFSPGDFRYPTAAE